MTPHFFYISDIANSPSFSGKIFRKKSMLEKFRANVLKWRARYIENLDMTKLRGNDQNVRYIEVIVNDLFVTQATSVEIL